MENYVIATSVFGMFGCVVTIVMAWYGLNMHKIARCWETHCKERESDLRKELTLRTEDLARATSDYRALELLYNELQVQERHAVVAAGCKANADAYVRLGTTLDQLRTQRDNILVERDDLKNKVAELTDRVGIQFANLKETENERDSLRRQLVCVEDELNEAVVDRDRLVKEMEDAEEAIRMMCNTHAGAAAERDKLKAELDKYRRLVESNKYDLEKIVGGLGFCLGNADDPAKKNSLLTPFGGFEHAAFDVSTNYKDK